MPGADIYDYGHTVYDQGGDVSKATSALIKDGAIDENSVTLAQTDEQKSYAADAMNTSANWDRINNFARMYVAYQEYKDLDISEAEMGKLVTERAKTLTDEEIAQTAQDAFNAAIPDAVLETVTPKGNLHDTYTVKEMGVGDTGLTEEQLADTKDLIKTEGVVLVASNSGETRQDRSIYFQNGEFNPSYSKATHAQSLVGWNDNYIFRHYTDTGGSPLQGAFIIRNSWDTYVANDGYGYLSYKDTSIEAISFFNAELDANRYTINQNNAPAVDAVDYFTFNKGFGTQAVANSFTAETDGGQFLKAVMFYASEKNMPYEIIVREGETPGEGQILTQQTGTFGEDGSAKWAGYRTVDLDNFVFLAKDKKYTVEVRTTSPEGKTVYVALMAGQDVKMDGESYFYDEIDETWTKTDKMIHIDDNEETTLTTSAKLKDSADETEISDLPTGFDNSTLDPSNYKQIYIFTVARNKESSSANGADFKVSWLDDTNSSGSSIINLGSATELYGTDYANPDRKTLSNMTVDLSADVYNFYRGSIIGEGSVTKTGEGFLALNGTNTYTGGTFVNNGQLEVNGSISGDATTTDSGIISGAGNIGGTLYNYNKAIAGNSAGTGNLTMENLVSSGDLVAQNSDTKFIVNGTANVEGSTVILEDATVGESEILTANSITGNLKTSSKKVSALLTSTANIKDNKIISNVEVTNNIGEIDSTQTQTLDALKDISATNSTDNNLRRVLNFDSETTKTALSEIGATPAAEIFSIIQQNSIAQKVLSDRLATAFSMQNLNFNAGGNNFADGENTLVLPVSVEMPYQVDNNAWVKFTKNWGELKGGANYHGQAISGGYDVKFSDSWRGGIFVTYNASSLGAKTSSGNIYDTRGGIYAGYHKGANDAFIYFDAGKVRNKSQRYISTLGLGAEANFTGNIFEIGGEFKHNLQPEKIWSVSPFINLQGSILSQNAYSETGAGIFNQQFNHKRNDYLAGSLGVEFKRQLQRGNFSARLGIKHAFTGADSDLNFKYEGGNNFYSLKNNQNKTHFVMAVSGEAEFAKDWIFGGDVAFQKGSRDRDLSASVMLRKLW